METKTYPLCFSRFLKVVVWGMLIFFTLAGLGFIIFSAVDPKVDLSPAIIGPATEMCCAK